ncbi:hypothetical protein AALO_G00089620 [Alosa alosa]|uniref:Uncharacterized protein n=1 Tax=Alosa alosa TaxID=278164 RepID=A0AAV6GVH7_9TELE|nr:hypothetical protein AALO_G00089620 [Alosa alosa]
MRNVRHEMEALVWLNRMLDPWFVIGHPKGLPHCSIGAPHVCGDVKHMKPYRCCCFNNADYDGPVNCTIGGIAAVVVSHDLFPPRCSSSQHKHQCMRRLSLVAGQRDVAK